MTLGRHARHYLLIGGVQWLVDWGVLVLLSHWGMAVEPANVAGRVAGALLGYWLNGKLTFAGDDTAIGCITLGNEDFIRLPSPAARITTCRGAGIGIPAAAIAGF